MTVILHLDSSARTEGSATRTLTKQAVETLKQQHPGAMVMYHDLTKSPLPHIVPEFLGGIFGNPEHADHTTVKLSNELIKQLMACDYLVIGAPMYNFGIPSQLKAWIDYICRAGKTFSYSEKGPEGLVKGKKAIIATAAGGKYSEGAMTSYDYVIPYLKSVLGFIGITDVSVVRAELQMAGPAAETELNNAKQTLEKQLKAA